MPAQPLDCDLVAELTHAVMRFREGLEGRDTDPACCRRAARTVVEDGFRTSSDDIVALVQRLDRLTVLLVDTDLDAAEVVVALAVDIERGRRSRLPGSLMRSLGLGFDRAASRRWGRALWGADSDGLASQLRRALGLRTPRSERPRCGARTRELGGPPCRAAAVWDDEHDRPRTRRGRCRMHGGLSTGPRTEAGQARAREALDRVNASRRGPKPTEVLAA
jgi:hypothetical protein